jgi:hypothetical protein
MNWWFCKCKMDDYREQYSVLSTHTDRRVTGSRNLFQMNYILQTTEKMVTKSEQTWTQCVESRRSYSFSTKICKVKLETQLITHLIVSTLHLRLPSVAVERPDRAPVSCSGITRFRSRKLTAVFQGESGHYHKSVHDPFLPEPFPVITYKSYRSKLHSLGSWNIVTK